MVIIHSIGLERMRFEQNEIKDHVHFQTLAIDAPFLSTEEKRVVAYEVEKGSLSFHHPLHYTLSWLLELGKADLLSLLTHLDLSYWRQPEIKYAAHEVAKTGLPASLALDLDAESIRILNRLGKACRSLRWLGLEGCESWAHPTS